MNELTMTVFVEQPLALPESASYIYKLIKHVRMYCVKVFGKLGMGLNCFCSAKILNLKLCWKYVTFQFTT